MKLNNMIACPECKSLDTYQYQCEEVSLWDDEFNKSIDNKDFITYKCKCNNCKKFFKANVILKCEIESYTAY